MNRRLACSRGTRRQHVADRPLPAGGAEYAYTAAGLLERLRFKDGGGTVRVWAGWGYDADRDVVTDVVNSFGTEQTFDTVSAFGYGYDALGQTRRTIIGAPISAAHVDECGYDDRSELTAAAIVFGAVTHGDIAGTVLDLLPPSTIRPAYVTCFRAEVTLTGGCP